MIMAPYINVHLLSYLHEAATLNLTSQYSTCTHIQTSAKKPNSPHQKKYWTQWHDDTKIYTAYNKKEMHHIVHRKQTSWCKL